MSEIPKRPAHDEHWKPGSFAGEVLDHEHAVAKVAVEALENIGHGRLATLADLAIAGRWHDFTDVLQREAREALAVIDASGWTP